LKIPELPRLLKIVRGLVLSMRANTGKAGRGDTIYDILNLSALRLPV